jgi:hypothetical protein
MDAHRSTLHQRTQLKIGLAVATPLIVELRVRNVDRAGERCRRYRTI